MFKLDKSTKIILPLRDIVVFPGTVVPLFVGRKSSVNAVNESLKLNSEILLIAQKDGKVEEPDLKGYYLSGTLAKIVQYMKLPDGTVKILVEGLKRCKVEQFIEEEEYLTAKIKFVKGINSEKDEKEAEIYKRSIIKRFEHYTKLNKKVTLDIVNSLQNIKDLSKLADTVISHIESKVKDKQKVLEELNITKRLELVYSILEMEIESIDTERKIKSRVKKQIDKNQKDYFLNEQLKAIKKELGGEKQENDEIEDLEKKINKLNLSTEAKDKCESELKKLKSMMPISSEAAVIRNYLDWITSLPWGNKSETSNNLEDSIKTLDEQHYGLEKVKDRIIEYLAVLQKKQTVKGPIICLVGPPGVGKTSLAKSIAEAIGRKFVKASLGGLRDESEIRGHRRTYLGSLPGKIIQSLKKAKTDNPLFLLDEIDKLGFDHRGDPASALLEVLDPEQNKNFNDHYLEVDYDLSDVMFVATANSLNMPPALLDRMEIVNLSGYTEDEKLQIAKQHLLHRVIEDNGLTDNEISFSDDSIIELIRYYTKEAGVRNLERELSNLARKSVKELLLNKRKKKIKIDRKKLEEYAGVKKYDFGIAEKKPLIGIVNGLAYTTVGGDLLTVEGVILPNGKGNIKTTGKLGEVMQESAQAAFSYVYSKCEEYGISADYLKSIDIHIHVPEGATPKDGPSAGVTLTTTIISLLKSIAVKQDIAMTGEITLRGRVLAIGGLKEKLLSALRGGIKKVYIPKDNEKNLKDLPSKITDNLEIRCVENIDEIIFDALVEKFDKKPAKKLENLSKNVIADNISEDSGNNSEIIAH